MNRAHAHREAWVHEDPFAGLRYSEAAQASFLEANHTRGTLDCQVFLGMNLLYLGAYERAEQELRATLAIGRDLGLVSSLRTLLFVQVLCEREALDEAEREARTMAELSETMDPTQGRGLWALGEVLYRRGDLEGAETAVLQALSAFVEAPLSHAGALATLARIQLSSGRTAEALKSAEQAMKEYEVLGSFGFRGAAALLIHAEALFAVGQHAAAIEAVRRALARILAQADKIPDAAMRRSFLEGIPEHRQLMALAAKWQASA